MTLPEIRDALRRSGFPAWAFERSEVTKLAASTGWAGMLRDAGVSPQRVRAGLEFWSTNGDLLVVLDAGSA